MHSLFGRAAHQFGEISAALLLAVEVKSVSRFCEAKEGVDARNDDPDVNREDFDADERNPDERVDHQPLVKHKLDDTASPLERLTTGCPAGAITVNRHPFSCAIVDSPGAGVRTWLGSNTWFPDSTPTDWCIWPNSLAGETAGWTYESTLVP